MRAPVFAVALAAGAGLTAAFGQTCKIGSIQTVSIPCVVGLMTSPPRTESCPYQSPHGWRIDASSFGRQSLGSGTGGDVEIRPTAAPNAGEQKKLLVSALESTRQLIESGDLIGARHGFAVALNLIDAPVLPTSTVDVRVTLYPKSSGPAFPPVICGPGNSTSNCPHAHVPATQISLICLPN